MILINYEYDFVTGKVIVALNKDCTYPDSIFIGIDIEKIEILYHDENATDIENIGVMLLVYLKPQTKQAVISAIEKLEANPCVVFAEPDYLMDLFILPNDPYYGYLWGMDRINAPIAWNYTTGSPDVVVGVIDSGIDYNQPDINNNMWVAPYGQGIYGFDFYYNNDNPMDETGHGTHVAGTIGAIGNNAVGVTGVCWNIKMAALKIGGNSNRVDIAAAIQAIEYANKNKISILNNSWGGRPYSAALKYAIDQYDGLFIAAAGNNGMNNDRFPIYPASYDSAHIISVAAINEVDALASFSNFGARSVDIAAPGTNILSTDLYGRYTFMNGTSMAAPHVAGAAALLKGYMPDLTTLEIKDIILSSANKHRNLNGRVSTGGILDVRAMIEIVTTIATV